MADVKFHLKDPKSKEPSTVFMVYRGTKPITKWSTGEKVAPGNWNKASCRARRAEGINYRLLNDKFDDIVREVKGFVLKQELSGRGLTPKRIKDFLNMRYRGNGDAANEDGEYKDLLGYIQFHRDNMKAQGKPIHKSFNSTYIILKAYFKSFGYHDYGDITFEFYSKFTNYLYSRGYSTNYVGRNIKNLKTVMGYAYDDKHHSNDIFRSKRFKVLSENVYNVYLGEEELIRMHEKDLSDKADIYTRVKDLFLIGCFVGSRFSNWVNMGEAQLTPDSIIYESVKHRERIEFPLHWIVQEIREKYNGDFPKPITNQVFNRYIKKVAEAVEINEEVLQVKTVGGKRVSVKQPKHQMISTHTARRSLATNLYLAGVPIKIAMAATGHAKVEQYLAYVKTSLQEESEALKNNPFFKKK